MNDQIPCRRLEPPRADVCHHGVILRQDRHRHGGEGRGGPASGEPAVAAGARYSTSAAVYEGQAVGGEMPGRFRRPVVETGIGNHGTGADCQGPARDRRQSGAGLEAVRDQLPSLLAKIKKYGIELG